MKNNWKKNLDVLANIAIIICCVLFISFLVRNYLVTPNKPEVKPNEASTTLVGKKLPNLNVDWSKNQQTLLIVLQKGCRFCD
jgi:hypothetical protein